MKLIFKNSKFPKFPMRVAYRMLFKMPRNLRYVTSGQDNRVPAMSTTLAPKFDFVTHSLLRGYGSGFGVADWLGRLAWLCVDTSTIYRKYPSPGHYCQSPRTLMRHDRTTPVKPVRLLRFMPFYCATRCSGHQLILWGFRWRTPREHMTCVWVCVCACLYVCALTRRPR